MYRNSLSFGWKRTSPLSDTTKWIKYSGHSSNGCEGYCSFALIRGSNVAGDIQWRSVPVVLAFLYSLSMVVLLCLFHSELRKTSSTVAIWFNFIKVSVCTNASGILLSLQNWFNIIYILVSCLNTNLQRKSRRRPFRKIKAFLLYFS